MALAVLACVGSLLGWQFTLAETAKVTASQGMFPALFARVNRLNAPWPVWFAAPFCRV